MEKRVHCGLQHQPVLKVPAFAENSSLPFLTIAHLMVLHFSSSPSVQFSCSVMSNSLQPHGLQLARLPCLSLPPEVCSNSCPSGQDVIQTYHPLWSPSPPAFSLSQNQGLFQWVGSSHESLSHCVNWFHAIILLTDLSNKFCFFGSNIITQRYPMILHGEFMSNKTNLFIRGCISDGLWLKTLTALHYIVVRNIHILHVEWKIPRTFTILVISSVQFSRSVMSDSLQSDESQHARPPCPSSTPGVHSDSCPLSQWCHPTISSSVAPFSSCPQSLPASGSFPMSQFFAWGGQSIGVSALASVLPINTQDWSLLE